MSLVRSTPPEYEREARSDHVRCQCRIRIKLSAATSSGRDAQLARSVLNDGLDGSRSAAQHRCPLGHGDKAVQKKAQRRSKTTVGIPVLELIESPTQKCESNRIAIFRKQCASFANALTRPAKAISCSCS